MKNIKIYKILAVLSVAIVGACTNEKTITVSEFLHDPQLIDKTRNFCLDNPGEREKLPNCINAGEALRKKMRMGESGFKCYKNNVPDNACIDDYLIKKGIK